MKVLLVDDMVYAREILREILEKEQIEVEEAENGIETLDKLKKYKFDVVLLDYILPDINGIDLLKKVKSIDNNIRAIITSGYQDEFKYKESINSGAEQYLLKPLDTDKLIELIKNR